MAPIVSAAREDLDADTGCTCGARQQDFRAERPPFCASQCANVDPTLRVNPADVAMQQLHSASDLTSAKNAD
jgi:hypothetical protein